MVLTRHALDGNDSMRSDVDLSQTSLEERLYWTEVRSVVPEEFDQSQLGQNTYDLGSAIFDDKDTMEPAAKYLNSFGQSLTPFEESHRLFWPEILDIFDGYGLSFSSNGGEFLEPSGLVLLRMSDAYNQQQVGVQIIVVKGADSSFGLRVFS